MVVKNLIPSKSYCSLGLVHCESFKDRIIVGLIHPETYVNKVVIGLSSGELIIFNINSKKIIHSFTEFPGKTLTIISGSPDPDIVALGFLDGSVTFFEIKKGQKLFNLRIDKSVSSLAFRTDETAHLAVGSSSGEIQIFDLDSRKLEHIISAHSKAVSCLLFVPHQPLLISSSGDNSIKEYLFETAEYRCLRSRSGHYKPPSTVRFYGEESRFLVSAGQDRSIRFSSIFKDNQNFEFSQGSIQKIAAKLKVGEEELKLAEVINMDIFETKTLKWDNMITSHSGQSFVKTWRMDRKTIGSHSLETSDKATVSHTSISACGNFGIVSTESGNIDVFNLQSGLKRRTIKAFTNDLIVASFTDATNTKLISLSKNGAMKIFDFAKANVICTLEIGFGVVKSAINKDTEVIACACDDNVIRVYDFSAMQVVRIFTGHVDKINDLIFSSDSKWLISCSRDKTIRTWDMRSGNVCDVLEVKNIPTAISISRNLEFLATCHEDDISISLWSNRSLYTGDFNAVESAMLWTQARQGKMDDSNEIKYSELPPSKWKNIYFLEKIRSNTRPVEMATKKQNELPFFLTQILEQDKKTMSSESAELKTKPDENIVASDGVFAEKIRSCQESSSHAEFFDYLKFLNSSMLDFEVSCISEELKYGSLSFILESLNYIICEGRDFEVVNAILALTFRHHESYISENYDKFKDILFKLSDSIKSKWSPLEEKMQSAICLLSFAREL